MANFEEIVVSLGLESRDFSTKVEALARQYDAFIKKFSEEPIVIKFDEKVGERFNLLLNQAQQNLAKFASNIKQKFQLEFNPNIANLDEIKRAVTDKMASLQTQLDRSPLNVKIDPKIFSDAARLLSVLEDIRKKEAAGGTAGTRDQERIASLTSNLTGLERIFNKGFFEKFNSDATTTVQRIDLLKTKIEQLTSLKTAQEKQNPAIQNIIKQLADLQKAFFSTQSVFPVLKELREDLDRVAATFKILQSTQGIPQEVISSFDKLAQTINALSAEEDQLKAADLTKSKEELEMETLFAVDAADKKAVIEEESLAKSQALKEKEVVTAKEAEEAKTQAVKEGTGARTTITSEGIDATISKIGKVALEFSGGQFSEPFQQIAKVSKDLSAQIDSNITESEKFIAKLSGLTVPPNSVFSQKKLEENLELQKSLKLAYDETVAAALRLKEADQLEKDARSKTTAARTSREEGFGGQADVLERDAAALQQQAASITENFNTAASRLVQIKAEADASFKALSTSFERAEDKTFNATEAVNAKLKVLTEERVASEAKAAQERERLAKASLFSVNDAEEKAIQKILRARETLNAKLLKLEEILKEQRIAIQNSGGLGLGTGEEKAFAAKIAVIAGEINRAKASIAAFTREEEKAISQGGILRRIFSGFSKNIFESIGAVIKFNTAWRLTGAIIEGALLPFTTFVDSIKDGFKFLVDIQQKVADIRELLVQNVTFSNDLATNFELAGKAAAFLAIEQERSAAQIGVASEKFRQVFESFTSTGGVKAVRQEFESTEETLTKATRTTALLIAALNAVGVGSENVRRQTTEIGKLLEGQVTKRDRIRIASGLTVEELNKQSLAAQKEGKFLEFVEKLFGAQVKRLETANDRFKELNTQVDFFVNRLKARLVEPVFEKIIELLKEVLKFLKENDAELTRIAKIGGQAFLAFLDVLKQIAFFFGNILKMLFDVTKAILGFSDVTDHASKSFDELTSTEKLNVFKEDLLVVYRTFVAIANVIDFITVGFKQLRLAVKGFVEDPSGVRETLGRSSPQVQDFLNSIGAFEEAENKFLAHRKKLKADAELLRADIFSLAGKGIEDKEKQKKLKDNLAEQLQVEEDFSRKQKEFAQKRLIAEHLSNTVAIQMLDVDGAKRVKSRIDNFEAIKAIGEKEDKELPKILGFPKKQSVDSDNKKFNEDRLNALKEAFKDELELRTQATETFIAAQEKFERLGKLSEKRVTENIKAALDARTEALEIAKNEFIAISRTFTEANPAAVAKFQSQISRQILDLRGKANKEKIQADEKQGELDAKLRDRQFEFERRQVISNNEFLLQLEKQAAEVGLKLKSETFDREIELERQKLDNELQLLDQELANKEQSEERKQEVNQKAIKAVEDFNRRLTILNLERIKTTFAEDEKFRETRLAQFKISQEKFQQFANIGADIAGTQTEKFLQQQIALESQRLVIQEELIENETKLVKIKEEQIAFEKEFAEINAKVVAGTATEGEKLALQNSNLLLNAKSELYRQIKLRIDEINGSLELQNVIIARSQAEEKARRSFGFQLGRGIFGNLPAARLERTPIPVVSATPGGLPNAEGATTQLVEGFKEIVVEAKPLSEIFKKLTAGGQDTIEALSAFGNAVSTVLNGITNAISAFQESTAQGVASVLGTAGQFLKGTIAGEVLSLVSSVVSGIASIFTALARRLAEQISKSIDRILHDFERGFVSLGDTIVRLENERLRAISELSGKKGGQKELDKILPGLEDKIASLIEQQKTIQESFDDQLTALRLGNDSLVEFHNKWKDVVKTVKDYLGSFAQGEDLINAQAKAAEFLSLSLKRIREDFQDQLADGEKEAIQEAIKLNDLFDERKKLLEELVKLQEDFNKAQFELLTADALEVRQAGAVIRGNQIVQLRKEFEASKKEKEDRLKELDQEIAHQARIVAQQKQIFNLASDTASLKARSNALEEQSLQRQLDKFKEIKGVIDGIVQDASGNFTISPNLLAAAGINPNTLNPTTIRNTTINNPTFNINVPEGTDGTKFGQDMLQSWQNDNTRFGFNNA